MSDFIEFKKVSVIRDDIKILNNINLCINLNENVAIIGPNGSGKSTFIKLITSKIYPSYTDGASTCRLFGKDKWNIHDLRTMLGIVTRELEYEFYTSITGMETVLTGFFSSIGLASNHVVTKDMLAKASSIIDFLDIAQLKNKNLDTMSSGELKRFLIARALVNSPKVLILDEPSNSLDIVSSIKLYNVMRKIVLAGANIVLVTHMVSDIIPEIKRFILFKDGKIFADGKRKKVFTDEKLSSLFEINIKLNQNNGVYNIVAV